MLPLPVPVPTSTLAAAPLIAVTYSSTEFAEFHPQVPWQMALRALVAAGGVPFAIDCATTQNHLAEIIGLTDGLLVLGGGDVDPALYGADLEDPALEGVNSTRDKNELLAIEVAREQTKPILTICRGFQLLNVAYGARLVVDLKRDLPGDVEHRPGMPALVSTQHDVIIDANSSIARWMGTAGPIAVNSQHHQGVLNVGKGLRPTARAADGLVEAVEDNTGLVSGVQWHPEFLWSTDANALSLLTGFVRTCSARSETEVSTPRPKNRANAGMSYV